MYDARRSHDWTQSANLMALLANCHRDPRKRRRPWMAHEFMPADLAAHAKRAARPAFTTNHLRALKGLFKPKKAESECPPTSEPDEPLSN